MAAEETLNLGRVISSISSTNEPSRQAEILNNAFAKVSIRQATEHWYEIASRSLEDLGYAKAFLVFMDVPLMNKEMGKETVKQLQFTLKSADKYRTMSDLFELLSNSDAKTIKVVKAKSAIIFQLLYLLRETIEEDGLPALRLSAAELVKKIAEDSEAAVKKVRMNLNDYGKAYWKLLIEQLKEADFQTKDNEIYEMLLTDSLIEQYQTGAVLVSAQKEGAAVDARLSDAVLSRMGSNIIKRLNLLLRTTKMYQSTDHPSVSAALQALLGTIENAMQGREGLTFTRVGSDLLIDDIKIRKKEKFLEDFVAALEARNVNSMTLKRDLTLDEARAFLMIFAQTESQILKKGGVKKVLESKGVSHILVDQFRYGIISGDKEEESDTLAADEKMLTSVVFSELLQKVQKGDVEKLSAAELGSMIKEMLTGRLKTDQAARQNLAQMLIALDPNLAEQAVFAKEGLRDEMSWSSARKMVDQLIADLPKGTADERIHTLSNLERMAELAISRNKETSVDQIIDKLIERLRAKERDTEVLTRLFEVCGNIERFLLVNDKYAAGMKMLRAITSLVNYCENLPAEKKDDYTRAVAELGNLMKISVASEEVVESLIREFESDSMSIVDNVMKMLELLGTEKVIDELLEAFKHPSRSVRNRAFQVLTSLGEKSLTVCTWKLKHINDTDQFSRRGERGPMVDDSYYVARNAMELVAKLGTKRDVETILLVSDDPDPRLRNEAIGALVRLDVNEAIGLAKMRLGDGDPMVVEAAINVLGQHGGQEDVPALVDLFFAEPQLRPAIINAFGRVGGEECEKILIGACSFRYGGDLGKIFQEDDRLRLAAIKALGSIGRERALQALHHFIRLGDTLLLRTLFVPWSFRRTRGEMIKTARDALARVEYRLKS